MARFDMEQTMAVAAIQQTINDWAYELDVNNGANIVDLVTDDCVYIVGAIPRDGKDGVRQFYADRLARLSATPEGVPVHRHAITTLRVSFDRDDSASATFNLIYFSTAGMTSGTEHADPAAYADVKMNFRREADGEWRISRFDSAQTFRRVVA